MIALHHPVHTTLNYQIGWLNEQRTVVVCQALKTWTWDDAHFAVRTVDTAVRSVPYPVHVIYVFEPKTAILPYGGNALQNLKQMATYYAPNTASIVIVRAEPIVRQFLAIAVRLLNVNAQTRRYIFVQHWHEALQQINLTHPDSLPV